MYYNKLCFHVDINDTIRVIIMIFRGVTGDMSTSNSDVEIQQCSLSSW
jgi:hypothetical protein